MKIAKITIRNFRGITELVITPERMNVILGPCGTGKTSVLSAIRFALTGIVSVDDIRMGEKNTSVTLEFEDGMIIERKRESDTDIRINGKVSTKKALNEFLEAKFGCSLQVMEAMCGSEFFESLNQKDLTKFIQDILPITVTFEMLITFLTQQLGRKLEPEEMKYLESHFDTTATLCLADIEKVYKEAFDDRTEKRRFLKALEAKSFFNGNLPEETEETLREQLSEIAILETRIRDYNMQFAAYKKSIEAKACAEKKLKSLKLQLESYKDIVKPDEAELKKNQKEKNSFLAAIDQGKSVIRTNQANIALYEKTLSSLDKPVCPISEKLVCSTDKSGLKNELTLLVAKNKEAIKKAQDFVAKCQEQVHLRDKAMEKYNANMLAFEKKEALKKQVDDFTMPEIFPLPDVIKNEDFSSKKKEINDKLAIITEYKTSLKFKEETKAVKKELQLLDFAVSVLDAKTGVPSKILQQCLAPIETMLNDKADSLRHGFKVSLASENGLNIFVAPHGREFVPLKKVSSGEFIFTVYLLMNVVHQVTGVSFLFIDNIDKLDEMAVSNLVSLIKNDSDFEHVFLVGVDHKDTIAAFLDKNVNPADIDKMEKVAMFPLIDKDINYITI